MGFIREVDEVKVSLIVDNPATVEVPAAWDVEPVLFRSIPK